MGEQGGLGLIAKVIFYTIGFVGIALTLLPLVRHGAWWIRIGDFPRLQILALGIIAFILLLVWEHPWDISRQVILIGVIAALAYQLKMVLPYTLLWKKQVKQVRPEQLNPEKQKKGPHNHKRKSSGGAGALVDYPASPASPAESYSLFT